MKNWASSVLVLVSIHHFGIMALGRKAQACVLQLFYLQSVGFGVRAYSIP